MLPPKRGQWKYRRHEADQMYHAEMRAFIAEQTALGLSEERIAGILQVPVKQVRTYLKQSIERTNSIRAQGIDPKQAAKPPLTPTTAALPHRVRRGVGAGPHRRQSAKTQSVAVPAVRILHEEAWNLRKRQFTFAEIASVLRVTEQEAQNLVRRRMDELDALELYSADDARKLMVAQMDDIIRSLYSETIGTDEAGLPVKISYEAIDRTIKLMKGKAELLGLNAATKIDLTVRLKELAEDEGYDLGEVHEVAAAVIERMSKRR